MTLEGWRDRLILVAPFLGPLLLLGLHPGDDGPTLCPFALLTGMACPGCGMTRAMSHLVQGDFRVALDYHPLVFVISVQLLGAWVWFILRRTGKVGPMSPRAFNVILIGTGIMLLGVWILRALNGTLPPV